jgi:hypothetical protein
MRLTAGSLQPNHANFRVGSATFTVQLLTRTGERFVLGPCCGETEQSMPPQRAFTFTVRQSDDRYLVLDTPPYMP